MKRTPLLLYSLLHLFVDFSCAALVGNVLGMSLFPSWGILLLYNGLAFGMELPVGIYLDEKHKETMCAGIGCLLIVCGILLYAVPLAACVLAGLGNALFHVGAGVDVLHHSHPKAKEAGIFISTGALGLYVGRRCPLPYSLWLGSLVLVLGAYYFFTKAKQAESVSQESTVSSTKQMVVLVCMFLAIVLRSYLGFAVNKAYALSPWLLVASVVLGKMLGGFLQDHMGLRTAGILSLVVSTLCFLFGKSFVWFAGLGLFAFNLSMPITLWLLVDVLKGHEGYAFGVLTFALLLGALPVLLGLPLLTGIAEMAALSLVFFLLAVQVHAA